MPKSIIEKLWDELDETVSLIQANPMQTEGERRYAQGLAFALSLMVVPYFTTVQGVSKEALRRYKMRVGELEFEPTPGYNYNPIPAEDNTREPHSPEYAAALAAARSDAAAARARAEAATPARSRALAGRSFTDKERAAILNARGAGFSDDQLAKVYKCKPAEIASVS